MYTKHRATIDWVLDVASPRTRRNLVAFTDACLQMHLASRQEKRVLTFINTYIVVKIITYRYNTLD